uniref:(northern house mosquito) hypothetical protein n=1 Tax=Culex pipiens TaxID=7175 RepID=A0A8D8F900_CULPI
MAQGLGGPLTGPSQFERCSTRFRQAEYPRRRPLAQERLRMLPTDRYPLDLPRFFPFAFSSVVTGDRPVAQGLDGPPTGTSRFERCSTMVPASEPAASTSTCSGTVLRVPYGLASDLARHVDGQAAPCDPRMFVTRMVGMAPRNSRTFDT